MVLEKGFPGYWSTTSCDNISGYGTEIVYRKLCSIGDGVYNLASPIGVRV